MGYDEQIFLAQSRGGISRYFVELIKAFRHDATLGIEPVLGWRYTPNAHAQEAGLGGGRAPADDGELFKAVQRASYYLANRGDRDRARRADVLHHTFSHERFLNQRFTGVRVCTVYDMIPELFPDSFSGRSPHLAKRQYVTESDVVLCISESTRRDLIQVYGDPGRPLIVTPLGVDPVFGPNHSLLPNLPDRFLLFVGKRSGYKDFTVLLEAFASMPRDATMLVAVGGGRLNDEEQKTLSRLGIADRVLRIEATDLDLPRIYAAALIFVFPSRHEGFGLPTLEAMASGIPVVLANTSSHPEVGGEVARYFPAGDAAELSRVLAELAADDGLRETLREQGIARAAQFSWAATATATAAAYAQVLHAQG